MTRGVIGRILAAGGLGVLTTPLLSAQAANRGQWNTIEYFQAATVESVTACLKAGAELTARDDEGNTPLHNVARHSKIQR